MTTVYTLTQSVFTYDIDTTFTAFNYNAFIIENDLVNDEDVAPPMCINCEDDVIDGFVDSAYDETHCIPCFTNTMLPFTK